MKKNTKYGEKIIDELKKEIIEKTKQIKRLEKELEIAKFKSMKVTGMKRGKLEKLVQQSLEKSEKQLTKKIKSILESHRKSPYEKKIALFRVIENLEVGEISPEKKKRADYLLQAHLYADLAKQSMKEYKKITVETFSKNE